MSETAQAEPDLLTEFVPAAQDCSWTVLASHHAHLDTLRLELTVTDVHHHVLNAQVQPLSVLIVSTLTLLNQALVSVNKAQPATMVKLKTMENAPEFVTLDFTTKTEFASSEDAQMDSKTTDTEDVLAQLSQPADANHQLSS